MLLGSFAGMNFMDFFAYKGRPGIFFAVQLGAAASFFVLYGVFHKNREKMKIIPVEKVRSWVPTIILICLIFLLALASFFKTHFSSIPGTICLAMGIMSVAWDIFFGKGSLTENLKSIQWVEVFFLMGIFVLVGSITVTGWTMRISEFLSGIIGNNIFIGYTLIVFVSMFLSAFVDNIPFLVAMIPVAISISAKLHINPSLFLFGLLIGSSLGGNITPIGASANIVSMGLLRKEGYDARFGDFVKIGLPFTLAAVTAAYLFIWFVWKG